jgi:hypothetical protein
MPTVTVWNERVLASTEQPVPRSDWCDHCGSGRTFYFQPGHERSLIYHDEGIKQVLEDPATQRRLLVKQPVSGSWTPTFCCARSRRLLAGKRSTKSRRPTGSFGPLGHRTLP